MYRCGGRFSRPICAGFRAKQSQHCDFKRFTSNTRILNNNKFVTSIKRTRNDGRDGVWLMKRTDVWT